MKPSLYTPMATRLITSHGVILGLSFSSTSVPKAARMLARRLRLASGDSGEISLIQPVSLNPEAGARVAAAVPLLGELLQRRVVRRDVDLDRDQLVAALAVSPHEPAPFEAQHLARAGALGNGQH